jgi:hypothetical protein
MKIFSFPELFNEAVSEACHSALDAEPLEKRNVIIMGLREC